MDSNLSKFVAVVEYGGFTKAATHIRISQPALSTAVKVLEKKYKQTLIDRESKTFQLTEAGKLVYTTASQILSDLNNLEARLSEINEAQVAKLNVGAIDSIAASLLGESIPTEGLSVRVDNSSRLIEAVQTNRIDFAFISEPLMPVRGIVQLQRIGFEPFTLVANLLVARTTKEDIVYRQRISNFLTYNLESTTYRLIELASQDAEIRLIPTFTSTSPDLIKKLILDGQGAGLLPYSLVKNEINDNRLSRIDSLPFRRPIALVYRKDQYLNSRQRELIASVTSMLE
jgi:DNA-binding transcriptional LysR family regulator